MTVADNYGDWQRPDLIAEIVRLKEELRLLNYARAENAVEIVRQKLRISRTQAKVVIALSDGQYKSRQEVHRILYWDRAGNLPQVKIIDVVISQLRKLLPGPMAIETASYGYVLIGAVAISAMLDDVELPACMLRTSPNAGERTRKDRGRESYEILKQLRNLVNSNMVAKFTSRQMASLARLRNPVTTTLERLEKHGLIYIRERPGRGQTDAEWVVYLRAKAQ